jgi:uncharacterized delta-60 repeat protein
MKGKIIVAFSLVLLAALPLGPWGMGQTQPPTELWVARYNGPGNSTDNAYLIAVDSSGNIYVTGYSYGSGTSIDYATIKYDTNGNQLWVARYNGPGNGSDFATAIAVDSSGNVYVTGYSYGSGWQTAYATIKYDTNGNQLWVARYNGPGNGPDLAIAIAVDSSGNVYVTGYGPGSGTYYDYATIKYDTNGNQLWVARYNGPGNSTDMAKRIAIDSSDNVYVTGSSVGPGTNYDYATIKYDTNGNQLWVARYNGPSNSSDRPSPIAVDSSGNVYVTGDSVGSGWQNNYATIKYDNNGNQLWVARYNGQGNGDYTSAIAADSSGNVYVTGYSYGSGWQGDYVTIKYDTNGNQLWLARYNGPGNSSDRPSAIAADSSGNIYVTGYSYSSGTTNDYATIKYDTNGNQLWVATYNGPGNGSDYGSAIALDSSGNVYVTGQSYGSGTDYDYATIKYGVPNRPPELAPVGNKWVNEGQLLAFTISSTDPDGDPLTYSATGLPPGATFNASAGTFSWTPRYDQAGSYNVTFTVSDGSLTDSETISISVNNVALQATVDIDPDTINLASKGQWITAYIELPAGYHPSQIDLTTVRLNNTVPAVTDTKYDFVTDPKSYITDKDGDGVLERMVKFDSASVQVLLKPGDNVVVVNGKLSGWPNQPDFAGSDTVKAK